jgi:hypothetical protein
MRPLSVIAVAACLSAAVPTFADQLVLDYAHIYSGDGTPSAGSPFARATFSSAAPGSVTLHLQGLVASAEFISDFYFNIDPTVNLRQLNIAFAGGAAPVRNGINKGTDAYKAGGGGKYDINISFPTNNSRFSPRLNGLDEAWFTFTSPQAITAASFDFLSAPHGGFGPYLTAAHFQGLGRAGNQSAWVSGEEHIEQQNLVVPLPASAWAGMAMLAGTGGVFAARRRRLAR